jgi:hypothetical protein
VGRYYSLFNLLQDRLNFNIVITDNYNVDVITEDVVIIFKSPEDLQLGLMSNLAGLRKSKKLIGYYADIHTSKELIGQSHTENKEYFNSMNRMLSRCDKILCPYNYEFRRRWPKYIYKYEFLPHFVDYEKYSNLKFNKDPIRKCLISGACNQSYKIRKNILENTNNKEIIHFLEHARYRETDEEAVKQGFKIDVEYIKELNTYASGLATSANIIRCVVAKYFEIPASGSLLLGEELPDLTELGFRGGVNYISITENNFTDKTKHIIDDYDKYENIRLEGRGLVLQRHTNLNRFEHIERLINGF